MNIKQPFRQVIAPNDRVHGDDGRTIHLIRTDGPTAYQFALERPLCRKPQHEAYDHHHPRDDHPDDRRRRDLDTSPF